MVDTKERILNDLYSIYIIKRRFPSAEIEHGVQIKNPERLSLGENVIVQRGTILHCGGMAWCNYSGGLSVGNNVYIGPYCVLFGAGGIKIGNNVLIAPSVVVTSHQHTFKSTGKLIREQPEDFDAVVIEDDVWIGSNAIILPGVTIGKGTVIGAGAVVTESVPPGIVAVGMPARVIRERK